MPWLLLAGCGEEPAASSTLSALSRPERTWITTDEAGAALIARAVRAHERAPASFGAASNDEPELVALRLPRASLDDVSHAMHEELKRCGGFLLRDSLAEARTRATPERSDTALKVAFALDSAAVVNALLPELAVSNLQQNIADLSAFPDRFHESKTGSEASEWIRDLWQSYAALHPGVKVELIEHRGTPQPSVSLTIPGSKFPEEQVILGGHLDSINQRGGLAPGADDNASGIAVLSEVMRVALKLGYQPERSVVFYGYAAEEIGLVGSAEIARAASGRGQKVAGVLQLDMTNYNPSPEPYIGIVTDYATPALSEFAKELIDTYVGLPWKTTKCGYACSDHASWFERDFPVHHVHETTSDESNKLIHTAKDTLELTQGRADHSLHFARYGVAFMVELAKGTLPPPPECDAGRPCANGGACEAGICLDPPVISGGAAGAASAGASAAGSPAGLVGGAAGFGGGGTGGSATGGNGGVALAGGGMATLPAAGSATALTPSAAAAAGCACRTQASSGGTYHWAAPLGALLLLLRRRRS